MTYTDDRRLHVIIQNTAWNIPSMNSKLLYKDYIWARLAKAQQFPVTVWCVAHTTRVSNRPNGNFKLEKPYCFFLYSVAWSTVKFVRWMYPSAFSAYTPRGDRERNNNNMHIWLRSCDKTIVNKYGWLEEHCPRDCFNIYNWSQKFAYVIKTRFSTTPQISC